MPNNKVVNFQMQQPGEMAQQQAVASQQQNRLSLAERLRRYGLDQGESGPQSFADSLNQQMRYGMRPEDKATQATPESNQSRLDKYYSSPDSHAGYTPDAGAQQRRSIMNRYNASGDSQMGYDPSAPRSAQPGMMGSMSRGANAVGRGVASVGKGIGSAVAGAGRLIA